jgi:amino acid transporter/nucleotide-binding universal stress UspA family protein
MKQKLDRSLGLFSAITISVGTMIGSAIFVLAGTSYETAGPAASLAIFLAGLAAVFTGFSFAELVTIIPKAGGGYAYVREATNNSVVGFICGWGFWLGYAMSCGLFALGFGNFLNYFFPFIPQMVGAYALVAYVVVTNIRGVKSSGKLQNYITTGLIIILLGYIIYGAFHMDLDHQVPYFPKGYDGMFTVMGFLYMTYIGYGLITTASEEVINPEKTIPKAIMISLVFVIFLKTATFFVGSGILSWEQMIPSVTSTPLTDTAVKIGGAIGGYLFAFAGILATVSSINTAVMASSRTSYALSRDQRFPSLFKVINPSTKTPIFSILIAGFIVVIAVTIRDLEHISTVTSIFSLTGYSLVNVALMIFRKKQPHLERKFKAPLYPLTPILGILVNLFLIYQLALSDVLALTIAVSIILLGLLYYYIGIPKLKSAPKGMSTLDVPHLNLNGNEKGNGNKKIFIPIANPKNIDSLVHFGSQIAMKEKGTSLVPLHVANATNAIPMDVTYDELQQTLDSDEILTKLVGLEKKESFIKPLVVFSRDIGHGIVSTLKGSTSPLLLMGWHSSGLAYNMNGGIVSRMLDEAPADIGILKDNNLKDVKKILFPYGGGRYSQLTASIVKRIADAFDAEVTVVRMVDELADEQEIENQVRQAMGALGKDVQIKIIEGNLTSEAVKLSKDYDLLILGASLDWGLKEYITGLRSDEIVEKAQCSTLVVKSYSSALQRKGVRQHLHNFKRLLQKNV